MPLDKLLCITFCACHVTTSVVVPHLGFSSTPRLDITQNEKNETKKKKNGQTRVSRSALRHTVFMDFEFSIDGVSSVNPL